MDWVLERVIGYWHATEAFFAFEVERLFDPYVVIALTLQVLLLLCSAFFSASETALFSLSRLDLQKLRRDRHPRSETLHALLDQPRRLIISILCGNELVINAATANLAGVLVYLYGEQRAGWINIAIMFPLLLLLGEVTPKTIAVSNPVRISAGIVAAPLSVWARLVTPLRRVIRIAADRITTWIVGAERARENILQVDELRTLLEEVEDEGVLDATERVLIDNLLWAGETEIVEIMTPRTRVRFLKDDMSVPEVVRRFQEIRHPRVPVCREHHDNLVGFVHAEDILRLVLDRTDLTALTLDKIMHRPVVVPPTKYVDEMFDFFQRNRVRAAAVLNEFGGVEGFVTMRDIVNFIFGEVSEGVMGQELYQERDENVYMVPGDMKLTDFNDLTNFGVEDPRMTTIGGVVFRYLDRLPVVGDQVCMDGLIATVLEMEGHRILKVRISKGSPTEEGTGDAEDVTNAKLEEQPGSVLETDADDDGEQGVAAQSGEQPLPAPATGAAPDPVEPSANQGSAEVVVLPSRAAAASTKPRPWRADDDAPPKQRDREGD